jgi:site-specific DNA-methyltransferase (adenine-specific)
MGKTKTSSFGTGKRESHDSSDFYNRSLFDTPENTHNADIDGEGLYNKIFTPELSTRDLNKIVVEPLGPWVDKIYCQSSESMGGIPDNSIALAFTSPPYNVGKDYDDNISFREYLLLIENVAKEVYRVLRPGGRYIINIANLGRKPYIPLHAYFYDVHLRVGFLTMGEIIWRKAEGASGSCAWGSWKNAKAPRLRDVHEYLLVFAKQSFSRPDTGDSGISPTEFMDATLSIWSIPPESAKRVRHPAPFPIKLAERVIELYSYKGDTVLDPFVGSGTTCVAAINKERHYVGFDISEEYCDLTHLRIEGKGKLYMPSERTECSELSVAFGVLGVEDPTVFDEERINEIFEGTVTQEKYSRYKKEYGNPKNHGLYLRLINIGKRLRNEYKLFTSVTSLQWSGPQKQAKTDTGAKDLLVANTPISVKAGSDIYGNRSPYVVFTSIPQGRVSPERSENWYISMALASYQELYTSIRKVRLDQFPERFPESVDVFEQVATEDDRKELQSEIAKLVGEEKREFSDKYIDMCHLIAQASAAEFNRNIQESLSSKSRVGVIEHIVNNFFRIDTTEYILVGISGTREFVVKIPSLSKWKREWEIVNIEAIPALDRKQSVVYIFLSYKPKKEKIIYKARFHVEIRWSHGKFRSAPEAKLYKDFKWGEVPFVEAII